MSALTAAPRAATSIRVDPDATVIVRWYDASGPMEAIYGPDQPWSVRDSKLNMRNDDWGWIYIQNPGEQEFLWASADPKDRLAARIATGVIKDQDVGRLRTVLRQLFSR